MATAPRQPVHAAHEFQELHAGEAVEEQRFVGHQADALLDLEFLLRQAEAEDFDRAAIRRDQPRENADGGGLPRAVGSQEPEEQPRGTSRSRPSTAALSP